MSVVNSTFENEDMQLLAYRELHKLSNLAGDFKNYLYRKNLGVGFFSSTNSFSHSVSTAEAADLRLRNL